MAYTVSNNDIISIIIRGKLFEQRVMTTFHYQYAGPLVLDGATWLDGVLLSLAAPAQLYFEYRKIVSADVVQMEVIGQKIYTNRFRSRKFIPVNQEGLLEATLTANVAQVVTLTADPADRHAIGNKHIPGVPTIRMTGGALTAGQTAALGTWGIAAISIIDDGAGGELRPIIFNRRNPGGSYRVTGFLVNPDVRTERRRTLRVGE